MKKILLFIVLIIGISNKNYSQVGIGTSTPDAGSILDLTNSSEKLLLLPKPGVAAPSTFTTEGMLFYNADFLYYKKGTGFNVLSPWLFDGTAANGTYVPSGTRVGIGVATTVGENVNLKIANPGDAALGGGSPAALAIGNTTSGSNLLLDDDEILARNGTAASVLKLQEGGGTVQVGQSIAVPSTLNVYGNIKQNDFDLLPVGTILMWAGTISAGSPMVSGVANTNWYICDGTALPAATQTALGITNTPDLRERFIVGAGTSDNTTVTGTTQYSVAAGGNNNNSIAHTHDVNPASFGTSGTEGTHAHSGTTSGPSGTYDPAVSLTTQDVASDNHTHTFTTAGTQGAHTHTIDVPNTTSGAATNTENRPPYYGLFFIMKVK